MLVSEFELIISLSFQPLYHPPSKLITKLSYHSTIWLSISVEANIFVNWLARISYFLY